MKKKLSKKDQALADFMTATNGMEITSEEMLTLSLKVHKVYADVLKAYLASKPVIQFNYLENLKKRTALIKTTNDFRAIVESDLAIMKSKKDKTIIEQIEYAICKKIYNDAVNGNGEEFEYGKDVTMKYDNEDFTFKGFFNPEDLPNS
jgi:hypothetical protein